jgi:hypothetical protein
MTKIEAERTGRERQREHGQNQQESPVRRAPRRVRRNRSRVIVVFVL